MQAHYFLFLTGHFLISCFLLLLSGCTTTTPSIQAPMFGTAPQYEQLDDSIKYNSVLTNASLPQVNTLNYIAHEIPSKEEYSRYQIRLSHTKNKLTEYHTTEISHGTATLMGHGIGYGGIYSIASVKNGALYNVPNYYKKYQWARISNVQGSLFPLKVGNELSFDYVDLAKTKKNETNLSDTGDSGKIIYRVVGHMDHYQNAWVTVPGDVYVIEFNKSTRKHPSPQPQNLYYFSQNLGWYIYAKYFFDGKPYVEYQLLNWK